MDDPPAAQPVRHAFGQGKSQVRAALHHIDEQMAFEGGLQAPPDGFDFGKFRHCLF
jgi:hypothetical protein